MGFDVTPVRPLGRIWTMSMVSKTIEQWLRKETQQELNPEFNKTLINVAIGDIAEFLSGAGSKDYGKVENINDIVSSVTTVIITTGASYTNLTRTITKTAHGYTSAAIGRRIVYYGNNFGDPQDPMVITTIESITNANNFVVAHATGINLSSIHYGVFSAHVSTTIDINAYRIAEVTKITDSITKAIRKAGDVEFENHSRYSEKQKEIIWYQHGDYLYLRKGTEIPNYGTLLMYFNSYPQLFTDDDSNLDIRDMYVPSLVIPQAKINCLEHLSMTAPESITALLDSKKKELRENITKEKAMIAEKNKQHSLSN